MLKPLVIALAIASSTAAMADTTGTIRDALVREIVDGDTFIIEQSGNPLIVDLESIDAPEIEQAYGPESKLHLAALIEGKKVNIQQVRTLDYQHITAKVKLEDLDINRAMIASGMAWHDRGYDNDVNLKTVQNTAKKSKIGLWADKHPIEPSVYRDGPGAKYVAPTSLVSYPLLDEGASGKDKKSDVAPGVQPQSSPEKNSFVPPPPPPPPPAPPVKK